MTEIEIDESYRVMYDGICWHLIHKRAGKRKRADSKGRWKVGDPYVVEDKTYYPTLKMALKYYLHDSLSEAESIVDIVDKIDEVENKIDSLNIVLK